MTEVVIERIRPGTPQPTLQIPPDLMGREEFRRVVGERLRQARLAKQWTIDTVVAATGIPRSNLSRIEIGDSVGLDAHSVYVLERLYGIDAGNNNRS